MLVLTPKGTVNVIKFLAANVANFENHSKDNWIGHAEAVATGATPGDDLILEVHRIESVTGNPVTLKMPRSWFKKVA